MYILFDNVAGEPFVLPGSSTPTLYPSLTGAMIVRTRFINEGHLGLASLVIHQVTLRTKNLSAADRSVVAANDERVFAISV